MKQENRNKGARGEEIASEHLTGKGYEIIERNFQTKFGEIDIIAKKDGVLVFVEVKLKVGERFGSPEEMVGKGKINKVKRMSVIYLKGKEVRCRMDVVAVVLDSEGRVERLTHYENVN